ncbi:MAG: aspartate aminotransferase family protein [Spirochaetia bacterium]|jgi:acetylornithine/N-succinyldiaminopimelate aminotransferase|nr:aspartate aminotransferase family protein [Spirochaetia bacterium]
MNDKFMNTYKRTGLILEKGRGATLWDKSGKEYIDFTAGIGVNSLGHGNPALVKAISDQAASLIHCSNYFLTDISVTFTEELCRIAGFERVFFCNSGAEANEGLVKIARKYGSDKNPEKNKVVTLIHSFHGRTITMVTATGQDKFHKFFGPFTPGFSYVPANDIAALDAVLDDKTCAFLFEPIQGEGGVLPLDAEYLRQAQKLCRERDILFAADEVQTGVGRTGAFLACMKMGLEPDLVSLAKGLAGGVPIGAILARGACAGTLQPGDHGTTFGGNPLAAAAAHAVLTQIDKPLFYAEVERKGEKIRSAIGSWKNPLVKQVRGMGLMIGAAVSIPPGEVVSACRDKGLLVLTAGDDTVRMLPPLVISDEEIDCGLVVLKNALDALAAT